MSRRSKWNPIPAAAPPTPKILNFPRSRRKPLKYLSYKGKLSDEDNKEELERRERVEEDNWRFQAEILKARSNILTTETELLTLKKLQNNRVKIEGRHEIFQGGEEKKLEELLKRLRIRDGKGGEDKELQQQVRMKMVEEDDCSASTSKRIDRQFYQESMGEENKCSGRCKAVVRRIVEQVRAETEEWSQMQQMMTQVRREMEDLTASRDYWQNRALNADYQIQSLKHAVSEWKHIALYHEIKGNQVASSLLKDKENKAQPQPLSLGKQLAKEKRMRRHESKEDGGTLKSILNRSPLREIGNSCTLPTYNRLHFGSPPQSGRSFRKCA